MEIQEYIIQNNDSFEPKHIFDCGQCFRWNEQDDRQLYWRFWKQCNECKKRQ